jgi:hypothetical protein
LHHPVSPGLALSPFGDDATNIAKGRKMVQGHFEKVTLNCKFRVARRVLFCARLFKAMRRTIFDIVQ